MTPNEPSKATTALAVMVVSSYVDRVREALLGSSEGWQSETNTRKRPLLVPAQSCRVVSILHPVTGSRKSTRGHTVLLMENAVTTLANLPPMARQNIAWGVTLTHVTNEKGRIEQLGKEIFSALLKEGFHEKDHVLRVDTFPKEMSLPICQSLQKAAGADLLSDPYEGPIIMTKSASKCDHVVSVVCHDGGYAWGVSDRATHFAVNLNGDASREILTKSNGTEDLLSSCAHDNFLPVSRAYYKLRQVWDEILRQEFIHDPPFGKGVDLGAAPGGWTQVLRQHVGLSHVISIDPGVLAHRVTSLAGVFNVVADMASSQAAVAIAAVPDPISFLVCDACVDSCDILEKIIQLMECLVSNSFALPAAFVITLKMPYKTPTSLDRNLEKVKTKIPTRLRKMASLAYEQKVKIRHRIVHLMANSDSERTLVVVFEAS